MCLESSLYLSHACIHSEAIGFYSLGKNEAKEVRSAFLMRKVMGEGKCLMESSLPHSLFLSPSRWDKEIG